MKNYFRVPNISYSELTKNASTKDKIFGIATVIALILTLGGVFGGLLTGTNILTEQGPAITPNWRFMIFGGIGIALAGIIMILINWRTDAWPMSLFGVIILVLGTATTLTSIEMMAPFRFALSSGNMTRDKFLYSCLTPFALYLSLEIYRLLSKPLKMKKVMICFIACFLTASSLKAQNKTFTAKDSLLWKEFGSFIKKAKLKTVERFYDDFIIYVCKDFYAVTFAQDCNPHWNKGLIFQKNNIDIPYDQLPMLKHKIASAMKNKKLKAMNCSLGVIYRIKCT